MKVVKDQCGREVSIPEFPDRIISLVPSQTELLFELGLDEKVKGITKFCVHPDEWFRSKARIGGTKSLDLKGIAALKPNLIIANKEENTRVELEVLAQNFPVWISDVRTLEQAREMIIDVGEITGTDEKAEKLSNYILSAFNSIQPLDQPLRALFLIWRNPWMAVSSDTFIHDMMRVCGLENCTANSALRYPVLTDQDIREFKPDLILLSSEPFPFADKHIDELKGIYPAARIGLVDGESFSWYGSRLCLSPFYFQKLIDYW